MPRPDGQVRRNVMSTGRVPSVLAGEMAVALITHGDGREGQRPVTLTGRRLHRRRRSVWTDAGDVGG
jgi:hypothetical protein